MKTIMTVMALCLAAGTVSANDYAPAMKSYLQQHIASWVNDPVLVEAIRAQNAAHSSLSQSQIDELDLAWRAQVGAADAPQIEAVLNNAAADFLRTRVAQSSGVITEAFAMDSRGLNVAASAVTSDYWQGDEAKFSETYPNGPGAVHFGEVEFDESSQTYQGQVSVVVVDPATGTAVGALTLGLNAEALM